MSRMIEILLFLTPFVSFAAWRLLFPSPTPPLWLVYSLVGAVAVLFLALLWARHFDAGDADQAYIPAQLIDGRVVPATRTPLP